jgi:hypothetical protein
MLVELPLLRKSLSGAVEPRLNGCPARPRKLSTFKILRLNKTFPSLASCNHFLTNERAAIANMPPLILHNVPDEELYVGDDGIQRPYAMYFPG